MEITLFVNGKEIKTSISPGDFLADTLKKLGFMSVRKGCDTSSCGLCSLWVDEKIVLSCTYLSARANLKQITTIEGVPELAKEFTDFLAAEGADQCGYCAPGLIMTVLAMKKELKKPNSQEISHYLNGNLCRCTGYKGQLRAIEKYVNS